MLFLCINTVETPISDNLKGEDVVVAYRSWALTIIIDPPEGLFTLKKRFEHIFIVKENS